MATKFSHRFLTLAAAIATIGLAGEQAMAANAVSGHASAQIVQAINVVENKQMDFGYIIPPAGGGTVVLTPGNAISGAGFTFSGTTVPGQFTATGSAGEPVAISFSSNDTLTDTLGTHTMTLNLYNTDAGSTPTFSGALGSGSGTITFNVGASLSVGANQAAGSYSGTYTVTVNY